MPTNEEILTYIKQGDSFKQSDNLTAAISEFQKALKIAPDNVEVLYKLDQIYEIKGDQEEESAFYVLSQHAYEKVVTKDPNNAEAHNALITLGVKQNRIDELIKLYKEKLTKYPDNKIIADSVKKLTTISFVSIPPSSTDRGDRRGCAKIFLDYIFPFIGIVPLLLGTMIPKIKILQSLGIIILLTYLLYKFSTAKKSSKR